MRVSFSSEGVDNEDDFNTNQIKNMKIIFTPGISLKNALINAKFEKEQVFLVITSGQPKGWPFLFSHDNLNNEFFINYTQYSA